MIGDLLTKTQIEQIVNVIEDRCRRFRSFEYQYESLFYEPYTTMRHKHTVTSAVISGFAPGQCHIEGITSRDLNYGLNDKLCQPELRCANGVFHIYSNGSDLKGKKIKERSKEYNFDITKTPLFFIIVVYIDQDGYFIAIDICVPNVDAKIVKRTTIYKN